MSYDLTIKPRSPRTHVDTDALSSVPGVSTFESHASQDSTTLNLNGDDAAIAHCVHHLLLWAADSDHLVFDPQRRRALQEVGELKWLKPSIAGKTTATQLKNLVKQRLGYHGFAVHKPRRVERQIGALRQGLEFLPPSRGRQAVNVYWVLTLGRVFVEGAYTASTRLARLVPEGVVAPKTVTFDHIVTQVLNHALPYLDRHNTVQRILQANDAGTLSDTAAFGPSSDWQVYYRALCQHHVGRTAEAIATMQSLIDNHSLHPLQRHANQMRADGKAEFAQQAERDFQKVVQSGKSWLQNDRKLYAEELVATWRASTGGA